MTRSAATAGRADQASGTTQVPRGQRVPTFALLIATGAVVAGGLAATHQPWPLVVGVGAAFVIGGSFVFARRRR